ncbi:hypothetical protein [Granulicella tundricola]|uniref:Uncharacterized protein n=1 Tax=Granulicella tundricola (strain ATCC BAA-1859 / DSM 23138 / MP5ACTX9) TaxID=1198114 RepID=E8X0X2_GRATM|nr:hypothetical protein [Granulicella tundricola]ADW70156.1 hypothetical protein AciX9_3144 [Granulicella tundricola MP5ACTX9]
MLNPESSENEVMFRSFKDALPSRREMIVGAVAAVVGLRYAKGETR